LSGIVLLVRHAAARSGSGVADEDRELTAEGGAAFARLARRLAQEVRVTRVLSSPFARARATADLLAAATGAKVEETPELSSGRSTGTEILDLARAAGSGGALVGHNPEMAEAIGLVTGREEGVPPGTVAALQPGPGGTFRAMWVRYP
jgi:phosphohistidine phosphatase